MNLIRAYEVLLHESEVICVARGNSMYRYIPNGSVVRIRRFDPERDKLKVGDIVLCKVRGNVYLHIVGAIKNSRGKRLYMIQNAKGRVNGWIAEDKIRGVFVGIVR